MMEVQVKVKRVPQDTLQLKLVGQPQVMGGWEPQKGVKFVHLCDDQWEIENSINVSAKMRTQFKLVRVMKNGELEWETMPNNSNRRVKLNFHSKLMLKWSDPQGTIHNIAKHTYRVRGLPGVIIPNNRDLTPKVEQPFNPFVMAHNENSDSDQEDEEFTFIQKRPKHQSLSLNLTSQDVEEIYYESTPVELHASLFKKKKVYIIVEDPNKESKFIEKLKKEIEELKNNYYFKWIIEKKRSQKDQSFRSNTKITLPELEQGKFYQIENFASNNSYFIFLDIDLAIKSNIDQANACLWLDDHEYEQTLEKIEKLEKMKFICFESSEKNKDLYNCLSERKRYSQVENQSDIETFSIESLEKTGFRPTLQSVMEELEILKFSKPIKLDTATTLSMKDAITKITSEHSTILIEDAILNENRGFIEDLLESLDSKSMMIVLSDEQNLINLQEKFIKYFDKKKVIFVFDSFRKFLYEGKQYKPTNRHSEDLQNLRFKIQFWIGMYGGSKSVKEQSFVMTLGSQKPEIYQKIQSQLNQLLKRNDYFKFTIKEKKIKIGWTLNPEIRLLRTLCRMNYINHGKLGDFQIISSEKGTEEIQEDLRLLLEFRSEYYLKEEATSLTTYSIGKKVSSKYVICLTSEQMDPKSPNIYKKKFPKSPKNADQLFKL